MIVEFTKPTTVEGPVVVLYLDLETNSVGVSKKQIKRHPGLLWASEGRFWAARGCSGKHIRTLERIGIELLNLTITETSSTKPRRANRSLQGSQRSWESKHVYEEEDQTKRNESNQVKSNQTDRPIDRPTDQPTNQEEKEQTNKQTNKHTDKQTKAIYYQQYSKEQKPIPGSVQINSKNVC